MSSNDPIASTADSFESLDSMIKNRIITGLLLLFPVFMTLWILVYVLDILTGWSVRILALFPSLAPYADTLLLNLLTRLLSVLLLLILLFLIGHFAKFAFARKFMSYLEQMALQIPMFKTIYLTIKQIIEAFRTARSGMFRQVVLIEYPRKGIYALAFLTNNNSPDWEPNAKTGKDMLSVFMPTTPNPTSGFLLFIPREECIFLNMDVSMGMKLVISGGVISAKSGETVNVQANQREIYRNI